MASGPNIKRWNSREGCFTEHGDNDKCPGNSGQDRGQQQRQRRNKFQGEGQQGRDRGNQWNSANSGNQNPENQSDGGQNSGYRNSRGQHSRNQINRGQSHGNQTRRGQSHGDQTSRGQCHGNQIHRNQNPGNRPYRGPDSGNDIYRDQSQGYQDYRGCGCGPDNQMGFYPGQGPQNMRPRYAGPNYGLLPDPLYNDPYNMQYPHPVQQVIYTSHQRPPMYGYGPGMPPSGQPRPFLDHHFNRNEQVMNSARDQGPPHYDGGNAQGMTGNMVRSQSSRSIDTVGSEQHRRNRDFRGRGGMPLERGCGNGLINRASSLQSINSVGSEKHDNRHSKERDSQHDRQEDRSRQNNTGARPKRYGNSGKRSEKEDNDKNTKQQRSQDSINERGKRIGRGRGRGRFFRGNRRSNNDKDSMSIHSEEISNLSGESDNFDYQERDKRIGRGRGGGRFFRGNRRSNNDKDNMSIHSDRISVLSGESDNFDNQERDQNSLRQKGPGNVRGFAGRGNRGRFRGRGNRGAQNFRGRRMKKVTVIDPEKEIERLNLTEDKAKLELLNRFLQSNRRVLRGFRGGRGRFLRGRWTGHFGKRGKREEDVVKSNVESDDLISISSEVSHATSAEPVSVSEISKDGQKFEICLDDINTVPLHTLRNRVMRYKKKLADMRKKNEDKEEIKKYQDKINEVKDVIQNREASEKKSMEKKASKTCKEKDKNKLHDENPVEKRESSSDESEREIKLKDIHTNLKKMHSFNTAKGRVSFKPRTQKIAKKKTVAKAQTSKTLAPDNENSTDSSVTVESENVLKEDIEDSVIVEKKKRQRNRNKKKENIGDIGDAAKFTENEKKMKDLLIELETISLKDNTSGKQENFNDSGLSSKSRSSSVNDSISFISDNSVMNDSYLGKETPEKERPENNLNRKISNKRAKDGGESSSNGPDVNEVFKFMVKILNGKGTPEEIKRESGLFPIDFDEKSWFRRLKRRFTNIERNGVLEIVLVSNRDATYCLDYITTRSCNKEDCKRYHVCKNLLAGNCVYRDRCKFSHDLLDERNMTVSKRLGYSNVFTSDEICYILQARYPHICHNWIDTGVCEEPICIGLHLCPRYLMGLCLEGDSCSLVHDKCSTHNKPIVEAYGMSNWVESIFKKMVYMKRDPVAETREEESENIYERTRELSGTEENAPSVKNRQISQNAPESENSASDRAICDKYIIGKCRRLRCKFLHPQTISPYVWQIQLCNNWINLDNMEQIEKAYCENEEFSQKIRLMYKEMEFSVVIVFKPIISAVAVVIGTEDGGIQTEVRRLSTMSYKEGDNDGTDSFKTQWRWYWENDYSKWNLFEQDTMQHTLEMKFLAKQKVFNYSRENYRFKYVIDFKEMTQRNIDTGKLRKISRRPIFLPMQHVAGKQCPASLSAAPSVETGLPQSWVPWDLAHPFELVTIEENSETYTYVSDSFYKTLSRTEIQIDSIFRMQNHKLRSLYCNQEKSMLANLKRLGKEGPINQRYLFHGTDSLDAVRGISINNLDNRVSGKNATLYGDGAYFARDAKYSHAYTGSGPERFMFMVTVLVGDYTLGDRTYRRPPNKPGSDHELYDSCVNNMDNPSIYIVFDKNQYYPEYLIQYHQKRTTVSGHGALGGLGRRSPPVLQTRRRSPSPPVLVYPHTSSSTSAPLSPSRPQSPLRVVYPHSSSSTSSSGGSSVRYMSATGSHSPPQRQDPVYPHKKNDSSCSLQ